MQEKPIELKSIFILLALSLVWGSSFILIKKALIAFEPLDLACMRISISSLAFTPILYFQRKNVPWNQWKLFLAVGLTGSGIPAFMYFMAQTNINSTVSGLLNSLTPIWTLLIGLIVFKTKIDSSKIIGVVIGFLGAALLMIFGKSEGENTNLWYGLFVVFGTLCYGMSGNLVKHYFQNVRSLIISAVSFFLIGPPAIAFLLYRGTLTQIEWNQQQMYSMGAVLLLSLVGTVLATIIFYKLIQDTNAVFGSSVAYLMPLVAMGWGFFDGEPIGLIIFISMSLILTGVYLIKKKNV
ncbi:MAG: DMT family transporter [Saprospiraceae bacterium]|nr:DMT family transporter [Saprospiraceae bacterium]